MTATDRHTCPDCGASHPRRQPKNTPRSTAANTDLNPGRCSQCHAPVMRGRIEGIDRVIDAQPINEIGLIAYRAASRSTFIRRATRARHTTRSTRWPPPDRASLHVEHDCTQPVPEPLRGDTVTHSAQRAKFETLTDPDY